MSLKKLSPDDWNNLIHHGHSEYLHNAMADKTRKIANQSRSAHFHEAANAHIHQAAIHRKAVKDIVDNAPESSKGEALYPRNRVKHYNFQKMRANRSNN